MFLSSQQETVQLFRLSPSTETTIITKHLHVYHMKQICHKNESFYYYFEIFCDSELFYCELCYLHFLKYKRHSEGYSSVITVGVIIEGGGF
jgi:hypothetical protein